MPSRPPTHRPPSSTARQHDARPNSAARGYDRRWRKLRLAVLWEEPVCMICHRQRSHHVDHIIAREKGGTDSRENLRGVCHGCHSRKTVAEDGGLGRGRGGRISGGLAR